MEIIFLSGLAAVVLMCLELTTGVARHANPRFPSSSARRPARLAAIAEPDVLDKAA